MSVISRVLHSFLRPFVDLAYPPTCPYCERRLNHVEQIICDDCRALLIPEDTWRCNRCGATGAGPQPPPGPCPHCPPLTASYHGILASTRYTGLTARCIYDFKYHRRAEMGRLMADVMVTRLAEPVLALEGRIGAIVPVPLHWRRRLWRGFNQSDLLAQRLSQAVDIPVMHPLNRTRYTRAQARIPSHRTEEREKNVRGAFTCKKSVSTPLPGVLLIDDVVTTAHTVGECARVLKLAGAPQVWIACFARA